MDGAKKYIRDNMDSGLSEELGLGWWMEGETWGMKREKSGRPFVL